MLRYATLTADGVTPAQAMRTASVDMPPPQAAGQGVDQVDPAVRYRVAVHAALDTALAAAVLADSSWPALGAALDLAGTDAGTNPVQLLADVAGQRNLTPARNPAAVLRYRLDPTPTPGDVLAANYPVAVADAQPRRTATGGAGRPDRPAQTQTRSRSRRR